MKALHFGAGNIGRGFIGPLLMEAGYELVFVDANEDLINALNKERRYELDILGEARHEIKGFRAILASSLELEEALMEADLISTATGVNVLSKIAPSIAKSLKLRQKPLAIIACENALRASSILKELIANELEIPSSVFFYDCAVDRIVPNMPSSNGLNVLAQGFYEWIIEGDLQIKGALSVKKLDPYLERKLFTLNATHAICAYLGLLKGFKFIREAAKDSEIEGILKGAMSEISKLLCAKHGFLKSEQEAYAAKTLARFKDPFIDDELVRVARNPLQKLGAKERLITPLQEAPDFENLAKGVAAALSCCEKNLLKEDSQAQELAQLLKEKGAREFLQQHSGLKNERLEAVLKAFKKS